nr:hypothetical protein [Tanacetum cinerariifolium]
MGLVDLSCGESGMTINSGKSGNSHFEAMYVKHIVVNSSNTDRNINFNKEEISRKEYEDTDVLEFGLQKNDTSGSHVQKVLVNVHNDDDSLNQQKKQKEFSEQVIECFIHVNSRIRNVLLVSFGYGMFKFGMWEWRKRKKASHIKFRPYVQVSVRQSLLPKSMIHFKRWLKLEKKWKGHFTGMGALTACEDDELSAVEPQMILARRMHKRDNKVDVYVLVQCQG